MDIWRIKQHRTCKFPFQEKSVLLDLTAKAAVRGDDSEFMHSDLFQFRKWAGCTSDPVTNQLYSQMCYSPCSGFILVSTSQQPNQFAPGEAGTLEQPVLFVQFIPFPFTLALPVSSLYKNWFSYFWVWGGGGRAEAKICFFTIR